MSEAAKRRSGEAAGQRVDALGAAIVEGILFHWGGRLPLLLLTLPALWPLLRPGFFVSDDGLFHVYRTAALADAWRHGVLYPRLFPEFGFGYGQAVLNFYAPLTYFPAALFAALGINSATAIELTIALGFVLAALAMYGFARSLWGPVGGVLAAVAYTYFPYHLADAYLRGAIPEHFAFIFPPLILWATANIFREEHPLAPALWAALAWAGLIFTHNLTALLMAPTWALFALILAAWTRRPRRFLAAAGSLILAAGLSAPLWLPFLAESRWVGIALGPSDGYKRHLAPLDLLIQWQPLYRYRVQHGGVADHPLSWLTAILMLLVVALFAWRLLRRFAAPHSPQSPVLRITAETQRTPRKSKKLCVLCASAVRSSFALVRRAPHVASTLKMTPNPPAPFPCREGGAAFTPPLSGEGSGERFPILAFALALTIASAFMITAASLPIWQPLASLLAHLQYPWRFLTLAALGFAMSVAALPTLVETVSGQRSAVGAVGGQRSAVGAVGVGLLVAALLLQPLPTIPNQPLPFPVADAWSADRMWREDAAMGQVGATWTGEFLPLTVREQRWALGRSAEHAADGPAITPRPQVKLLRLGYDQVELEIASAVPLSVRLHQFHLPAWRAILNDDTVPTYPSGELGLVTADLPPGGSRLAFSFGPTAAWMIAAVLACAAALLWAALAWRARPGTRALRRAAVGLLIVAALLMLNRLGIGRQSWTPQPVGAAVGDVALLLGYDVAPARGAEALDVTLYWFALRDVGENYKTFVHLVGPDGGVLAQHDGDPGGGFTPTSRWRSGELIADRHRVPLPTNLPAGTYGLKAGMYRPEPLHNLPVDPPTPDGRVDLGIYRRP